MSQDHDTVLFVSKEVKLSTEVIPHVRKMGEARARGRKLFSLLQFLTPSAELEKQ